MTDFDAREFPFVFECQCGEKVSVSRREAIDLAPHEWRPLNAAECVMMAKHGWWKHPGMGLTCSDCLAEVVR